MTVSPQPDGSFTLALDYPLPYQQILFELGNTFYTAIYANKALCLELDMKKKKVRYLSADGPMNEYLNNFIGYKESEKLELYDKIGKLMQSFQTAPDSKAQAYHTLYDSLTAHRLSDYYLISVAHILKRP
jgi:hypothetical protein